MLFNRDKIILDLCSGSGAWSEHYKDAGYDVRLITLPEHDVTDYMPPKNVYGILAAPPCTEFSLARNAWPEIKRDFIQGMIPVNACYRILYLSNPKFFALENPVGLLSRWLGQPKYIFEPWWFGDPWSKKTALWGFFNKPKQIYFKYEDIPLEIIKNHPVLKGRNWRNRIDNIPSIATFTSSSDKELRAITPPGFAKAFFESNR